MDFSTTEFWLSLLGALPIVLGGNYLLRKKDDAKQLFHKVLTLLLSITLLGVASLPSLIIFLYVTMLAYGACKWGEQRSARASKSLLWVLIPLLLLPLLYYKYAYFIGTCLQEEWDTLKHLIIPIGISFYTFQIIGFCIDTLIRKVPMPTWLDYMNFSSFFPQIVAGPIERRDELLPQMQRIRLEYNSAHMQAGVPYIILGLFFKLALADNLALSYSPQYSPGTAIQIWMFNLIFTFRIYFDFAGYGLTAYGLAKCLGITLRMNFLSPYTASNITDFWRRWHTSLTTWFRDYIYFPLGGNRTKRWAINLLLVFAISGLWHGAGWNFILWGSISGLALIIHKSYKQMGWRLPGIVGWGVTFGFMVFIWMFFYINDANILTQNLHTLITAEAYDIPRFIAHQKLSSAYAGMPVLFIPLSFIVVAAEFISQRTQHDPYKLFLHPFACGLMVFLIIFLQPAIQNQFIYFAF